MKKFAAILCLLALLTSCGAKEEKDLAGDANTNVVENESIVDVNPEGELNEEEILEDIDNLLEEIINTTETGSEVDADAETEEEAANADKE